MKRKRRNKPYQPPSGGFEAGRSGGGVHGDRRRKRERERMREELRREREERE